MKNGHEPLCVGALYKVMRGSLACLYKDSTMDVTVKPAILFFPGTIFLVVEFVRREYRGEHAEDQYQVLVEDKSGYMYVYDDEYGWLEKLT